ncbi:Uncharacterised protein [Candidatus Tiddalikarchaeum anstoanum]|nr:Uncharacterised protein [Candidatus Tiddalikarchaeum anstoanum]
MIITLKKDNSKFFAVMKNLLEWEGLDYKTGTEGDIIFSSNKIKTGKILITQKKLDKNYVFENNTIYVNERIIEQFYDAFSFKQTNIDEPKILIKILKEITKAYDLSITTKWYYPKNYESAFVLSFDIDFEKQYANIKKKNNFFLNFLLKLPDFLLKAMFYPLWYAGMETRFKFAPNVLETCHKYGVYPTLFLRTPKTSKEENGRFPPLGTGRYGYIPSKENDEVGLHFGSTVWEYSKGFVNDSLYDNAYGNFTNILVQKRELERYVGKKVIISRVHNGYIFLPLMLENLDDAEIALDSSLYQEVSINYGKNISKKIRPKKSKSLVGISILFNPVYKTKLFKFYELPVSLFECHDKREIIDSIKYSVKNNEIINVLYHPSLDFRGLRFTLNLIKKRNIWITNMTHLAEWFRQRSRKTAKEFKTIRIIDKGIEKVIMK